MIFDGFSTPSTMDYVSSASGISPRHPSSSNLIMCMEVFKLAAGASHTHAFGLLRSAGSIGASVFYELIEADHVPIHAKVFSTPTRTTSTSAAPDSRERSSPSSDYLDLIPINCRDVAVDGDTLTATPPLRQEQHQPNADGGVVVVVDTIVVSHVPMILHGLSLDYLRGIHINHIQYVCHPTAHTLSSTLPQPSFEESIMTASIDLKGFDGITETPPNFLCDLSEISSIDIAPLSNVTRIERFFLAYCTSLTTMDASPLRHVTNMGDYFMNGCSNLTEIDISGFNQITTIGDFFIAGCKSLKAIDLGVLSNVSVIGRGFLSQCFALKTVDIAPLRNCSRIGRGFMNGFKAVPPRSGLEAVCSVDRGQLGEALQGVLRHLKL